jgi:hypothetical protein
MAYVPTDWVDGVTPVNAANLDKMEAGIVAAEEKTAKGQANGYASLDGGVKVPVAQLPDLSATYQARVERAVADGYASLDATGKVPLAQLPPFGGPTYGTTLPASPVDGQEHILVNSTSNPSYQWRFRYNQNSSSPYKWEFIGGAPAWTSESLPASTTSTSYINAGSISLTGPRAGEYYIAITARISNSGGGGTYLSHRVDASVGGDSTAVHAVYPVTLTPWELTTSRITRHNAITAGAVIALSFRATAGTAWVYDRSLSLTPIRVS